MNNLNLDSHQKKIIETIISNNLLSQNEISVLSKINKALVSKAIAELEAIGLITIDYIKNRKYITFNQNFANVIILEIDRYFIKGYLNNSLGKNIHFKEINMSITSTEMLFEKLEELIDDLLSISTKKVLGIGIAVHGIINEKHEITYSPNTDWTFLNLKQPLERKYSIKTTLYNIANINVLTERDYAYNNSKSILSITINSGVGAGLIINDNIYIGATGSSLEFGHMKIYSSKESCACGQTGCIEAHIAYPKIINTLQSNNIHPTSIDTFIELYKAKDPSITKLYNHYIEMLAYGLENLLLIVNPDVVVLNCKIIQHIPKSIELLKSNMKSPIANYNQLNISTLTSDTRLLGLNNLILQEFLNVSKIDFSNVKEEIFSSYNQKK